VSHVTSVNIHIKDLEALKQAAKELGLELVKQDHFKWYGTHVGDYPLPQGFTKEDMGKCEYAIRLPGNPHAYEVGVCKRRDGKPGYQLLWDFWSGGYGLQDAIGKDGQKLKQGYAVQVAKKQMQQYQRDGFRMVQYKKPDGTVVMKAMRG
jgi:hypothetical protein